MMKDHFHPLAWVILMLAGSVTSTVAASSPSRPNILLAIADDQSFPHASIYGCRAVRTPAFDRVAASGVLFLQAVAASPGCSPSRAALLTGRHHWQLQQAGTHASSFPKSYLTFPDLLETNGYFIGFTGKGWGPGNFKISGRTRNPAGPSFANATLSPPAKGISRNDYAGNFAAFLQQRPSGQPFCFWYGATEPHRDYDKGYGLRSGKKLADVEVPPFLPDTPEIRSDLLDYFMEIEWFDRHLGRMLQQLEEVGELTNTLVIVTADNGMPFPRAKANLYEYGIHVPLAMAWPARFGGGRQAEDPIGFVDITATILEAAGIAHPHAQTPHLAPVGRSVLPWLQSPASVQNEKVSSGVFSGRERHSSSRHDNLGYPGRAIRTGRYLYIRNFAPQRWPAGDPQKLDAQGRPGPRHGGYHDIDACPTLDYLIAHRSEPGPGSLFAMAVEKRPAEELFDVEADPGCLRNVAGDHSFQEVLLSLRDALTSELARTGDPRLGNDPEVWETYPRYSPIRAFPPSP